MSIEKGRRGGLKSRAEREREQREMEQQRLDEAVNRFQFEQNVQDQKLQNYMNLIQGNYGGTTVSSAERGGLGLAGALGQGVGGLAALGGLMGM